MSSSSCAGPSKLNEQWDDSDSDDDWEAADAGLDDIELNNNKEAAAEKALAATTAPQVATTVKKSASKQQKQGDKGSGTKVTSTTKEFDADDMPLDDPIAEKARQQRMAINSADKEVTFADRDINLAMKIEKADMENICDMFGVSTPNDASSGCEDQQQHVKIRETTTVVEKDSFEELQLKTLKDVEQLSERCVGKLNDCRTKAAVFNFMRDTLRGIEEKLDQDECTKLIKELQALVTSKKQEKAEKDRNRKKQATDVSQMKKGAKVDYQAEIDMMYGDDGYGEYDDEYDDYADFL
ncbi:conserved hypothetical protein [Perkinsus marinus ATCC 50983]|uniref:Eukaryotic translation initiation factor 3 30 kDa subunit n=2 Tax=Perkinsus marinus (strain ATCC 50983 / TXsc) TaxID=423536 RepID=C5LLA6_PERM5|nr:conserved hypothetical protein [Perkinsus marinus ATCC 50983]EER02465.1 conserved hypothetical protein [Perkinsus marinus ATCC 50983]|eukprot:XP_002769747.1 conserved hypothetical protein [Perkinsus marinus ATCC 50983]